MLSSVGLMCSTIFVQMEFDMNHFGHPKGNQCDGDDGDDFTEVHWL